MDKITRVVNLESALIRITRNNKFPNASIEMNEYSYEYVTFDEILTDPLRNSNAYSDARDAYSDAREWIGNMNEEHKICARNNRVWTLKWYPNTPVGFCKLHASSLLKITEYLEKSN